MSKRSLNARKQTSTQEIIRLLERDLSELKALIKSAGKLKGRDRSDAVTKIERKNITNIRNLLISFETNILTLEEQNDYNAVKQLRKQYKQFEQKFTNLEKQLQFTRHEGRREEEIYEDRKDEIQMTKHQYATKIEAAQKESENAVKNMLRMLHQTKQIGNSVNAELQRQLQALDSVNDNLMEAESNLNRAMRHINYFARSVYTDKLLIFLIILCVGAVIAIIVLSAMGKVPAPAQDALV